MMLQALLLVAQVGAPVAPAGAITGRVVDAATNRPVSAAVVTISGAGQQPRILTGSDGRFVFSGLPVPGSFSLNATKGGYADGAFGRRKPGGTTQPVRLEMAAPAADLVIRVWRNGAIGGTILDEAGEPLIGVQVRVLLQQNVGARRRFVPAGQTTADDRGIYRVSNLLPGDYLVAASPPPASVKVTVLEDVARTGRSSGELGLALVGMRSSNAEILEVGDAWIPLRPGIAVPTQGPGSRLRLYPPTLHPSAAMPAQATIVTLAAGEERSSIDIQLSPVTTARVSGQVVSPSATGVDVVNLRLLPAQGSELPPDLVAPFTTTDSSGLFSFAGVLPGQYTLLALRTFGGETLFASVPVTVGGDDIDGLVAALNVPPSVSGRYEFEGAAPRPSGPNGRPPNIPLFLDPVEAGPVPGGMVLQPSESGFTIKGYLPGRYRVRLPNSPQGWMFKGAMLNGIDVSETPFELTRDVTDLIVVFTDRWSGISGAVQGAGADGATVLVFPTDAQSWPNGPSNRRIKSARASARGEFGIGSLPPGDYYAIAVNEEETIDWRDPIAALDTFARLATRISIVEGEHKTIDLQVREVRK